MITERKPRIAFLLSKPLGLSLLRGAQAGLGDEFDLCVVNFDDRADGRSVFEEIRAVGGDCRTYHEVPNKAAAEAALIELEPDLTAVSGWYYLLSQTLLDTLRGPIIGVHGSLLPRYRGFAPTVWSMIAGEPELGYSIFSLRGEMDAGDLYYQFSLPNRPDYTVKDILDRFAHEVRAKAAYFLEGILTGTLPPYPQEHGQASYGAKRIPADGQIDWSRNATQVHNFIRAQSSPYPGAFTGFDGQKLIIERSRPSSVSQYYATAGQVIACGPDHTKISCGEQTVIELLTVRLKDEPVLYPAHQILTSLNHRLS